MRHCHLSHERYTRAAIDDVIERGLMQDWLDLRNAARAEPALLDDIARVCAAKIADPYARRYHFWNNYARGQRGTA